LRNRKNRPDSSIGRLTELVEMPDTGFQAAVGVSDVADSSKKPEDAAGHWSTH
jgi:hypothetical protein